MAAIFGAVASGAGLISLSMQLETMALALRQFEQYRQNDLFGSELLDRCIIACDQAVFKIKTAVENIGRLLRKARLAGRIYMGFKEPEVRKLLEDMERAKSSMLLAYTSYCQYVSAPKRHDTTNGL